MSVVKIVPMPGPGGSGGSGDTGNFTFVANDMTTDGEMSIGVNGVPGSINLSAYSGIELSFADAEGAGLRFPDGSIQTTAYTPSESFIPLPEFLSYETGRDHLPTLNNNFGWDAQGLWFGYSGEGSGTSYPVFTNFTINGNDAVTVEFNVNVQDECSDVGVCVYLDGDTPQWQWGTDVSRIAAQFDCLMPTLLGRTESYQGERTNIPAPGMYRIKFTYNPIGGTPVQFEYYQGSTLVNSMTLNETLGAGSYRVGFASDNNDGKTYISDLSIMVNENIPYTDTLQNGNSGVSADIADFVFTTNSNNSYMTIHNHDMVIRTTRDDDQDADISLTSADDIWIDANDSIEITSIGDDVRIRTADGDNIWSFAADGILQLPGQARIFTNEGDVIDNGARTYVGSTDALGQTPDGSYGSLTAPLTSETQWFADGNPYFVSGTATLADSTVINLTGLSSGIIQETPAVYFLLQDYVTKTASETYPYTIDVVYSQNLGPKTTTTLEVEGPGTSNRIILDIDGAYVGAKEPQNQVVVVGSLDSGPKTWVSPSDNQYRIYQAHGGEEVVLNSAYILSTTENYVTNSFVNTTAVEMFVDMQTESILIQVYNGVRFKRYISITVNGIDYMVNNLYPVGPSVWHFDLSSQISLYPETYYTINMNLDGDPIVWWNAATVSQSLSENVSNFRGAKIDYHAYNTNAGTIIGSMYIADDSGNGNITHLETASGGSDISKTSLWYRKNGSSEERKIYAYNELGDSDTIRIHWTAQVYYSPEYYD